MHPLELFLAGLLLALAVDVFYEVMRYYLLKEA